MVREEFVDRSHTPPFGGEGKASGPLVIDVSASSAAATMSPAAGSAVMEPRKIAAVPAQEDQPLLPPWRAAAQAKGRPGYFLAKRCLDCSVALIAIVVLAPVFLVTALLIRLTSPGPATFCQERVGFRGRHFVMKKFRSMYINSDERLHQLAYEQFLRGERTTGKVDGTLVADGSAPADGEGDETPSAQPAAQSKRAPRDPRITPLGHVLRQTSIDELPQFFNVLRGDMSLVGPRPPIPYEVSLYDSWHLQRLDTLPGITGIWQVHGRSRVSFEEMVQMDLEYIQKQSFWFDIKLLCRTIPAVLSRKGAE